MKTRRLMVTRPHKYGTRHLVAGEEYDVPVRHALALVAGKKARFADDKPAREPTPKAEAAVEETTQAKAEVEVEAEVETTGGRTIESLRLQALQLGIEIDGRWGVARLQHEISQARR